MALKKILGEQQVDQGAVLIEKTNSFNPYQRFEETKIKNFQHSSRLEGITPVIVVGSLESVLAKYRRG